ncbi:hypothetical protein MRX96_020571 [Rhipicephalus microplus]
MAHRRFHSGRSKDGAERAAHAVAAWQAALQRCSKGDEIPSKGASPEKALRASDGSRLQAGPIEQASSIQVVAMGTPLEREDCYAGGCTKTASGSESETNTQNWCKEWPPKEIKKKRAKSRTSQAKYKKENKEATRAIPPPVAHIVSQESALAASRSHERRMGERESRAGTEARPEHLAARSSLGRSTWHEVTHPGTQQQAATDPALSRGRTSFPAAFHATLSQQFTAAARINNNVSHVFAMLSARDVLNVCCSYFLQ